MGCRGASQKEGGPRDLGDVLESQLLMEEILHHLKSLRPWELQVVQDFIHQQYHYLGFGLRFIVIVTIAGKEPKLLSTVQHARPWNHHRRVVIFLVVEPSKIKFLILIAIPQMEDRILLYNGYHSIPK